MFALALTLVDVDFVARGQDGTKIRHDAAWDESTTEVDLIEIK